MHLVLRPLLSFCFLRNFFSVLEVLQQVFENINRFMDFYAYLSSELFQWSFVILMYLSYCVLLNWFTILVLFTPPATSFLSMPVVQAT